MTAAQDALHTAELLEMILVNIDMHTLLLAQGVNCFWLESIQGTVKLRKKLFHEPATTKDIIELNMAEPLPQRAARASTQCQMVARPGPQPPTYFNFSLLNPLFEWRLRYRIAGCSRPLQDVDTPGKARITPSWHNMLSIQPPQFELWISPCPQGAELPGSALAGVIFSKSKILNITMPQRVYEEWLRTNRFGPLPPAPSVKSIADFWEVVVKERELELSREGEEQENCEL